MFVIVARREAGSYHLGQQLVDVSDRLIAQSGTRRQIERALVHQGYTEDNERGSLQFGIQNGQAT